MQKKEVMKKFNMNLEEEIQKLNNEYKLLKERVLLAQNKTVSKTSSWLRIRVG